MLSHVLRAGADRSIGRGATTTRRILLAAAATLGVMAAVAPMRAQAADTVIAAVGELVCDPADPNFSGAVQATRCQQQAVSDAIVADAGVQAFLPLGNNQNLCGGRSAFNSAYNSTYGRLLGITYPIPGNVEYRDSADAASGTDCAAPIPNPAYVPGGAAPQYLPGLATGYFGYFGDARTAAQMPADLPADSVNSTKGFYAYDIGSWRAIAINTNELCLAVACRGPNAVTHYKGSTQERWLRAQLASAGNRCVIAYMNYPRWSSNLAALRPATADPTDSAVSGLVQSVWRDLYEGGAEVLLGANARNYERFVPMNNAGVQDAAFGVRQFVVGTGGIQIETNKAAIPGSAAMQNPRQFGYLRMVLKDGSYTWAFKNIDGSTFDAGQADCHGAPIAVTQPSAGAMNAGLTQFKAKVLAPAASDSVDFFLGKNKLGTAAKATADCHVDVDSPTDKEAWYTSPFCVYSLTASTATIPSGTYNLRAVANSTDPATPGATTESAPVSVVLRNGRTFVSTQLLGTTTPNLLIDGSAGSLRNPAFSIGGGFVAVQSAGGILVGQADGTGLSVVPGTAGATKPAWGPGNGSLLFLKSGSIFSIPIGGGVATKLATGKIVDFGVSPNGGKVVFQRIMPNGKSDLFTMRVNGTLQRNFTKTKLVGEVQPTWRTNTDVVFVRKVTGWRVWHKSTGGGAASLFAPLSLSCQQPAFSPNGANMACVATVSGVKRIKTMNAAKVVKTLQTSRVAPTEPAWATNTRVAFVHK